jgi:mono/diheme cytochrome c family protein
VARVKQFVSQGGQGMIAYADRVSSADIDAVARFVATASRAR